jgi:hypothetical protein
MDAQSRLAQSSALSIIDEEPAAAPQLRSMLQYCVWVRGCARSCASEHERVLSPQRRLVLVDDSATHDVLRGLP